jgi:hypothetical protein
MAMIYLRMTGCLLLQTIEQFKSINAQAIPAPSLSPGGGEDVNLVEMQSPLLGCAVPHVGVFWL